MENLDVMVLRTLRDWRRAGKRALLALEGVLSGELLAARS